MSAADEKATGARRGRGRAVVPAVLLVILLVLACPAWGWLGFGLARAVTRCAADNGRLEMDTRPVASVDVPVVVCWRMPSDVGETTPLWELR